MLLEELLELFWSKFWVKASGNPEEMERIVLCGYWTELRVAVVRAAALVVWRRPVRRLSLGSLTGEIGVEDEGSRTTLCGGPPPEVAESFDLALNLEL